MVEICLKNLVYPSAGDFCYKWLDDFFRDEHLVTGSDPGWGKIFGRSTVAGRKRWVVIYPPLSYLLDP